MISRAHIRLVVAVLFAMCWIWTASLLADGAPTTPAHQPGGGVDVSTLFSGAGGQAIVWVLLWTESRKQRDEMTELKRLVGTRPCVMHGGCGSANRADDEPGEDHRPKRRGAH